MLQIDMNRTPLGFRALGPYMHNPKSLVALVPHLTGQPLLGGCRLRGRLLSLAVQGLDTLLAAQHLPREMQGEWR